MFTSMYSPLFNKSERVTPESLKDQCQLRNIVVRLYIYKELYNLKAFDPQFL